jgi:hypothetical protein
MRRSLLVLPVLLLLAILAIPLHAQPAEPPPAPDFSELERTVLDELAATGTPGAAVAVIQGERADKKSRLSAFSTHPPLEERIAALEAGL